MSRRNRWLLWPGLVLIAVVSCSVTALGAERLSPSVITGYGDRDLALGEGELVMRGTVNPNGSGTTCVFELGPDAPIRPGPYTHAVPCAVDPGGGTSEVEVSATVAAADVPPDASHFRLVATNAHGTTYGEDQPIGSIVCSCWPLPTPSETLIGRKAVLRAGYARLRVGCWGGESRCIGDLRLLARVRRGPRKQVRERLAGEGAYELSAGRRRVFLVRVSAWASRLLERAPNRARFVIETTEPARRPVRLSLSG
jgi:hypothetical protein